MEPETQDDADCNQPRGFLIGINSLFPDLSLMSEQKKQGLSQLAAMLEVYLQQEVTPELPPSCRELLTLIAKVSQVHFLQYQRP